MCACDGVLSAVNAPAPPYDPRYEEDAYEPMSDQEFDVLVGEPDGRWTTWLL